MRYDVAVIGGGILGLTTALALQRQRPRARILVLEKERDWARHQSGRNSGVLHSGLYYRPGSWKARLTRAGRRAMLAFTRARGLPCRITGKLVVAVHEGELSALKRLHERGRANGLRLQRLDAAGIAAHEPHARGVAGLHVPEAGLVDFARVAAECARLLAEGGADLRPGAELVGVRGMVLDTSAGAFEARLAVNCAGLYADRVARLFGLDPPVRVIPFRGEYAVVTRSELVRAMVYPVPDPALPFLGVHLTRGIDGVLRAGPNAVLALAREGYRRGDRNWRDLRDIVAWGGFWRLAARHWARGAREFLRSRSRRGFLRAVQRLVPEVRAEDLREAPAGVRAQAVDRRGQLVNDFLLVEGPRSLHLLNAPSPAATASFAIAALVRRRLQSRV